MYRNRESAGCFNTANFLAKLKAYQDTRPERIWVADTQRKYLRPYEDNGTETYIPMLAGRKTHQREQVKTYNAYYYASKYVSDFCTSQNIMVRGNTPTVWQGVRPQNVAIMRMYIDCYVVITSTSNNVVAKTRGKRGVSYTMDFTTVGQMNETELYFCSAPMIQELSGLAALYFKQNNFAMATNLQRLEIGSNVTGYTNPNLEGLTIGNSKMLEYLDVRNCPNVTGALDLSGCLSLKQVYLENTKFTGISFAPGGLLEIAHLPAPSSLTMRELIYLQNLSLENAGNLFTLRVEECEFNPATTITIGNVTTTQGDQDILITLINAANSLSRIRLIGVDWLLSNTSFLDRLSRMAGIDDDAYDIPQSVLTGDAFVSTMRQSSLAVYNAIWPYLTLRYDALVTQFPATFVNLDGEPIYDLDGNEYVQWVDAGTPPYDPVTKGYDITIRNSGAPFSQYNASTFAGKYYLDISNGNIYLSNGTVWYYVDVADVLTPTYPETAQYTYEFSGWDTIEDAMTNPRTITAQYTLTEQTYTVKFYRDPTTVLRTVTNVPYGGCVGYASEDSIVAYITSAPLTAGYLPGNYTGKYIQDVSTGITYYSNGTLWTTTQYDEALTIPTFDDNEDSLTFRVFRGWDKNTGFITGDVNVYAQWFQTYSSLPVLGTRMNEMNVAQISGICKRHQQDAYFEPLDYVEFQLGHDFNFTNVNSVTIGEPKYADSLEPTITLPGVTRDRFKIGGYYFDGNTRCQTNLHLFAQDAPAFTMAIDFDFIGSTANNTLISANYGATENFRLAFNGTYAAIYWGDKYTFIDFQQVRGMVVLRHPKNSNVMYVYSGGYTGATQVRLSPNVTRMALVRDTEIMDEPLMFGCVNYYTQQNTYRNYGIGHIHWLKIWYDDLGDGNAFMLASWPHETMRMETWGSNKYELADNSGELSSLSFISNTTLAKQYYMNSAYVNGWEDSLMRQMLNHRFYKSLPIEWRALVKPVHINTTAGGQSSVIVTTDDYVYLSSYREQRPTNTNTIYDQEVGVSPQFYIPWMVNQGGLNTEASTRLKFANRIREYNLPEGSNVAYDGTPRIYYCNDDPAETYTTDIAPGSIWLDANYSSRGRIFVSQDELNEYGITPAETASPLYAQGGWINMYRDYCFTRSPYIDNATGFQYITYNGGIGGNLGATGVYGVIPCFSI